MLNLNYLYLGKLLKLPWNHMIGFQSIYSVHIYVSLYIGGHIVLPLSVRLSHSCDNNSYIYTWIWSKLGTKEDDDG
jgi:hypothetical protein